MSERHGWVAWYVHDLTASVIICLPVPRQLQVYLGLGLNEVLTGHSIRVDWNPLSSASTYSALGGAASYQPRQKFHCLHSPGWILKEKPAEIHQKEYSFD